MQDRRLLYTITCLVFLVCAVAVTIFLFVKLPPVAVPWTAAIVFVLFATAVELLAVNVNEDTSTSIRPTSTLHWAAPSIFGPFAAVLICVSSAFAGHVITGVCSYLSRVFDLRNPSDQAKSGTQAVWLTQMKEKVVSLGSSWHSTDLRSVFEAITLYASTQAVGVGLSGLAYFALGGKYLIQAGPELDWLFHFILPYLGLIVVSLIVQHGEYIVIIVVVDPVQGGKGWYSSVLRAKIALIEDVLPVWKGELFLIVVSILMAYLYSRVGVMGLVLAIMPVLALRDFFRQWIQTKEAYLDTITTLATYMQHYHPYTRGHLKRVAEMSERLARELRLPAESIRHMNTAGFLHDIGKIAVSEEILDKTDKLTDDEWATIKEHPVKGAEIISHLEFLEGIVDWIKYHHKWYNGMGYPGSNGNGSSHVVPIEAAIIATADAFDAMTDDRELAMEWRCDVCGYKPDNDERPEKCPNCNVEKKRTYREPKSLDQAIDELRRGAGTQFDPRVVKAFLTMVDREGIHLDAA